MNGKGIKQAVMLFATAAWIFATWFIQFQLDGSTTADALSTLAETLSPAVAGALCWRAARRTGDSAWRAMAFGCAMWTIGSLIWTYYIVFEGNILPFPSFADVGYLLLFPPAIVSALWLHESRPKGADRVRSLLDALLVAGSLTVVLWWALLASAHRGQGVLEPVLSVSYVVGDIVVVSLLTSAIRRSARRRRDLLWLLAGFAFLTAADALFAYQEATDAYLGGWFPDFSWIAGFSLVALAAVVAAQPSTVVRPRRFLTNGSSRYVPYLAAVTVTAYELVREGHLDGTQGWATIALAAIAFSRQVAAQVENNVLTLDLEVRLDELTHSHARFFTVFDESIEALALLDRDGRVRLASRQLVRLSGVTAEELIGREALAFVHEADRDRARVLYDRVMAGEASSPIRVRVPADHALLHVELTLTNLLDTPEVGGLLLGCRDVSERLRHEQELATSQSRFRAAFDHAPIGMVVVDADGTVATSRSSPCSAQPRPTCWAGGSSTSPIRVTARWSRRS
jgi:PAS domain S-box-containing protein